MNADKLLDAIGMVDDRFLKEEPKGPAVSVRRRLTVLVAAVMVLSLSVGSVMAATQDSSRLGEKLEKLGDTIQQAIFSVLHIETPEKPPVGSVPVTSPSVDGTQPSEPALKEIDVVNIDGVVNAHYFMGEGYVQTLEGGFYTYSGPVEDDPPEKFRFWEIRKEGVVEVASKRSEFLFVHDGRQLRIIFDHAIINEKLWVMVWPKGLGENTYLNGWNVEPIGDRTDMALMSVPVMAGDDISYHYFLLDMATLETAPLLKNISTENLIVDHCTVTGDLNYATLTGIDLADRTQKSWVCDLRRNTITQIDDLTGFDTAEFHFLDDSTLICEQWVGDGSINIVRHDMATGEQTMVVEAVKRAGATGGYATIGKYYGMLYGTDGSAALIDLQTGEVTALTGLELENAKITESPNGRFILIGYQERAKDEKTSWCYPKIGLLDPQKEEMRLLTREISGNAEYLRGWLDDQTVVITTGRNEDGGYYMLVYEFVA